MARLTVAEKKLLRYPPTETTWRCQAVRGTGDERVKCGTVNSGKSRECFLCRRSRPAKPQLVWPLYLAACKKAGITPGDRWRESDTPAPTARPKRARKKAA